MKDQTLTEDRLLELRNWCRTNASADYQTMMDLEEVIEELRDYRLAFKEMVENAR